MAGYYTLTPTDEPPEVDGEARLVRPCLHALIRGCGGRLCDCETDMESELCGDCTLRPYDCH